MKRVGGAFKVSPIAAGVFAFTQGAAFAQTLGQAPTVHVAWWRVAGSFLLCMMLAVGGALALRARLGLPMKVLGKPQRRLRLLETIRLSHQTDLCLVSCDGREFMVAATPHGAVLLGGAPPLAGASDAG